ncbi:HMG box-containing protein 4-like [Ruditapes philippinarum]|uniref:HMG box-containing protein 4-like n=1 Tax=Ruditapes philippinarum TaxID=129788 RepID=UPI00295C0D9E|nr:HMG box-containing protein 4-like [Ruditapes philippinarum]
MATKRKRDVEEDALSTPASKFQKQDEVTRSGRVRKKPAKFVEENKEESEIKPDVAKLPRSPPVPRVQQVEIATTPPVPAAKIVMVPVKQEVQTPYKEDASSNDEDSGKPGRSSRARKKSAKVLEMEEFEEAEKKQVKKDPSKKSKSPVAQTGHEVQQTVTTNLPIPILKIKDIPTLPKVETVSPPGSIHVSPSQKSPVAGSSKSPIIVKSPDNKASVIKLLLSSPTQSSKPASSNTPIVQSPQMKETKTSSKKTKAKSVTPAKQASSDDKSKIRQVLEMSTGAPAPSNISIIKQRLNAGPDPTIVKPEPGEVVVDKAQEFEEITAVPVPMIHKETKSKRGSKKVAETDESPFMPPPVPSPNVIHVGPMNIGLEVKQETDCKKKKGKVKTEAEMEEAMIHEDFGLDMPEIELGEPGNDSFIEMEEDDGLMIPEEEVVTTEKKGAKDAKKKTAKGKKKLSSVQLGDIPNTDGELVMDFARMKSDDKKKKKEKPAKEESEATKKKRAPTAYMLWCTANRQRLVNDNPGIDFSTISKTLGEMWSTLSEKDKMVWKRKAKKAAGKGSTLITTGKANVPKIPGSQTVTTARQMAVMSQKNAPTLAQALLSAKNVKQQPIEDMSTPVKGFGMEPVDVAAHLKIVGESLSIIGMKLQEHRGLIAVQGSLSVLLDSMLCTVAPLMCLTSVLPETNGLPAETHMKNLDNIAYIMPGL